ncbi:ABC-F family ATP-binding cassette domain-containing protein [Brachybacterium saurashtrense]|uniref:ABC transporter ATP-binding protein n=1 Tax=Brachybacterium saurashtrense TaxID=556288 RepID=A0A345YPY2_9MICO|nr:ABC-F family ATP-binding cassette domain-containing protein [Brachybacterium saurashtrense]AXK45984.1 ABC transporter ATP-binding protein [Brachybacterium saurashtrense]RRR23723.1 ABC transporter ATP-binding protein [Brachybacterium saurashtrense]
MPAHPTASRHAPVPAHPAPVPSPGGASGEPSLHLRADGLSFSYPDRRVLTDVSLVVPAGRPTGLLGENGSGKSTLLRVLAGELAPEAGGCAAPGPVGVLHQELRFGAEASLTEVVADALERSRRLERALEAAGEALAEAGAAPPAQAAQRYDALLAEATLADVWNAEWRAEEVLAGLGLAAVDPATALGLLSGGQRERLALAHLLIARPTTWLLDEPTNHLDDAGAAFLAAAVAAHPGPVLIASHDRAFLDDATAAQIDLDPAESPAGAEPGGATVFTGGFSDHLLARFEARDRWEHRFRAEQEELAALRRAVKDAATVGHPGAAPRTEARAAKKFYADRNAAVVSRRLREARERLDRLEREQVRKPPAELHLTHLPAAGRREQGVQLAVSEVAVAGRLAPTSFRLSAGERLLITGANGTGKSTLLDVIAGRLAPTSGTVDRPRGLRIGHLGQDDTAVPGRSVGAHLRAAAGLAPSDDAVPELFGLVHPRDLGRELTALSRGQLRRVMLAAVLLDPPELLVLDEPTNHLALVTATRLEAALQEWDGTVLLASHDRWLRRRWDGEVLELG